MKNIIITRHTSTGYINRNFVGKIWMGKHCIAIDYGTVFGYVCIRMFIFKCHGKILQINYLKNEVDRRKIRNGEY